MWKNKKTSTQGILKKISKFFVNGQPMSQVVHWSIIIATSGIFAINIARAGEILEAVGK